MPRRSRSLPIPRLALAALLLAGCPDADGPDANESPPPAGDSASQRDAPLFRDVTAAVGLTFRHDNGMSGERYFVEPVGAGGALFDHDGDGDLDLWLVDGGPLTAAGPVAGRDRLFRNDLGPAGPRLVDVTAGAGIADGLAGAGHGMGAFPGDADGDGDLDLLRTAFGPDRLWINRGDGSFREDAAAAGLADPRWTTGAAWLDADGDGDDDLYVAAYVAYRLAAHLPCRSPGGRPDYCNPQRYEALPDRFYENRGDGRFADVSAVVGVAGARGRGLGVVSGDWNGDGRVDLYVTNDLGANMLWENQALWENQGRWENQGGGFAERALAGGAALSPAGRPEASMGVESGDLDGDGDEDLVMTHLEIESSAVYRNDRGGFYDVRGPTGIAALTRGSTGFGVALLDADMDGDLDVVIANGAVREIEELARRGDPYPLGQRDLLLLQEDGRFEDESARAAGFAEVAVSRGVAAGDLDGDGDLDLVMTRNAGPARVLAATADPPPERWVGVAPRRASGAPATGTRLVVACDGRRVAGRRSRTDGSYLSARDPRLVVALPVGCDRLVLELAGAGERRGRRVVGAPRGRYLVATIEPTAPGAR